MDKPTSHLQKAYNDKFNRSIHNYFFLPIYTMNKNNKIWSYENQLENKNVWPYHSYHMCVSL